MDIPRYRIGNDLTVLWAICNNDGTPFDLSGKVVRLFVTNDKGITEVKPTITSDKDGSANNVILWNYPGDDQKVLGKHTLTVEILTSDDKRKIKRDVCDAFTLVSRSESEETGGDANFMDSGSIYLSTKLDVYRFGNVRVEIGTNGNWFIDGYDTGKTALGGGPGLVNIIYKESDLGGEFQPDSVIDTFNANAINAIYKALKAISLKDINNISLANLAAYDVLTYNGSNWINLPFKDLINLFRGPSESGSDTPVSGDSYWILGKDEKLYSNYDIYVRGNAVIEGDTSSGGDGQDTPAAGGSLSNLRDVSLSSLSEGDVLVYDKDNGVWYNVPQSNIVPNLEGYAKQTWVTENFLKSDTLDAYKEELGKEVKEIADLLNSMWRIKDNKIVTDMDVLLKKNLIVEGDTSSGGEGQDTPTEGTVTGIEVNGTPYKPNTQGVIDLSDAFKAIDVSDQLKDYYTQTQTDLAISTAIEGLNVGQYAKASDLDALQAEVDNIESVLGMDEEAEGIINTWNEVKAFLGSIEVDDDLASILEKMNANIATRALDSDLDTLAGRVGVNELAIADNAGNIKKNFDAITALGKRVTAEETVTNTYASWWADLKKYIRVEGGNIKIDTNLIVEGDTSSGGSGQDTPASGTVTGIKVGPLSTDILTPNNAGIIDMVSVLSSIDVSDQLTAYAKTEDVNAALLTKQDTISDLATIRDGASKGATALQSITKNMVDSVLGSTTAGNANRFLMSTGSTSVWAAISDYALPKSGNGMLSFDGAGRPVMLNNQGYAAYNTNGQIEEVMWLDTSNLLQLGGTTSQKVNIYGKLTINYQDAIHSGNIGSQSVAEAKRLLSPHSYPSNVITNTTTADSLFSESYSFSAMQEDHPLFGYATIWNFSAYLKYGATQLAAHYNALTPRLALRNYNQDRADWSEWREFAFLDDNVASAQALTHSNGTVGAVVENDGNIVFKHGSTVYQSGGANVAYYGTAQSGLGSSYDGALMYAYHDKPLYFYTGGIRMLINSSGNVTIGSSDLAGTRTKLYVDGILYNKGDVRIPNGVAFQSYLANGTLVNLMYLNASDILTIGTTSSRNIELIGNVGIGTNAPKARLDVNGSLYAVEYSSLLNNKRWIFGAGVITGNENHFAFSDSTSYRAHMIIDSVNSYVGIGTTSPAYQLDVNGDISAMYSLRIGGCGTTYCGLYPNSRITSGGNATKLWLYSEQGLAIYGSTIEMISAVTMASTLSVSGNITCSSNLIVSGDTSSGSDIRFKDIIKNKTIKIEHIAKAPLFTFKWNDREDDTIHLGSSAQYWEKVCPWLVTGEDFKSLNYAVGAMGGVISLARHDLQQDKEIKALKRKEVNHEERIKVLERKVKSLEEENRRLRYGS